MRYRLRATYNIGDKHKDWIHGDIPKSELHELIDYYLRKALPVTFEVSLPTGKQKKDKYFYSGYK